MKIDILELQKKIEEQRLIYGSRLEKLLLLRLESLSQFIKRILTAKSCAVIGCLVIITISILVRSIRDIGYDSALNLSQAQAWLSGKNINQPWSLTIILSLVPALLQKFLAINSIIFLEIFINFLGIISVFFSARILAKSEISQDRIIFNLLLLSCASGFFLRIYVLQFNEFGTASSYFLALAFPYIFYHLVAESKLTKSDHVIIGNIAGLLCCLKNNYAVLVILFELVKYLKKPQDISGRALRISIITIIVTFYLLYFPPDFAATFVRYDSAIISGKFWYWLTAVKEDFFLIFLLNFSCLFLVRKNQFLWPLALASFASELIVLFEVVANLDQRSVLFSLTLPFAVIALYVLIRDRWIIFRQDWLLILLVLFLPQFDDNFFLVSQDINLFWWLIVLVLARQWAFTADKKFFTQIRQKDFFAAEVFLPHDWRSWLKFSILVALTFLLISVNLSHISWAYSAVIFLVMVSFYQKLYEQFYHRKEFSKLSIAMIFLTISYFISLHLTAIFNFPNSAAFDLKSPNYVSDQIAKTLRANLKNGESFKDISSDSSLVLAQYLKVPMTKISDNPRLIFIDNRDNCKPSSLEIDLRDSEYRKNFFRNYRFLNRIIERKNIEQEIKFFNAESEVMLEVSSEIIKSDIEVYKKF